MQGNHSQPLIGNKRRQDIGPTSISLTDKATFLAAVGQMPQTIRASVCAQISAIFQVVAEF